MMQLRTMKELPIYATALVCDLSSFMRILTAYELILFAICNSNYWTGSPEENQSQKEKEIKE